MLVRWSNFAFFFAKWLIELHVRSALLVFGTGKVFVTNAKCMVTSGLDKCSRPRSRGFYKNKLNRVRTIDAFSLVLVLIIDYYTCIFVLLLLE